MSSRFNQNNWVGEKLKMDKVTGLNPIKPQDGINNVINYKIVKRLVTDLRTRQQSPTRNTITLEIEKARSSRRHIAKNSKREI